MKIENAIIDSATLRFEYDGRFLCLNLRLKTQYKMRKFGGISLGNRFQKEFNCNAGDYAFWWIKRVFDIVDVNSFDELIGKPLRIEIDNNDSISAIGHVIKDDWFCPKKDFEEAQK